MRDLLAKIYDTISKHGRINAMYDLYYVCLECLKVDRPLAVEYLKKLSGALSRHIPKSDKAEAMFELHKKVCLTIAKDDFESYMLYIEWNREPDKKFYVPRQKALKKCVDGLQDLADDKIDLLAISLPPGVGKSTLAIFYLTWLAGRNPNEPMLGGSHSNSFLRGVYDECYRIITSDEYLWGDVFQVPICNTNAKDMRIDLDMPQRFETLEFSSIGSGNAGKVRAKQLLYCDDLVDGIETAMSKDRMDKLWQQYTTDLRQRKIGNCKELHIATRWSVNDVIGRLEREYEGNDRARFIVCPALDKNDESNFDYPYGVGFTTKFYHEQRDIMDEVSWKCLYMNEPIEREGLLFDPQELRRYFELPYKEPDNIIAVCDTKDRGTDYCVMPIAYQYGQDFYIEEIICDNGRPEIVEPRLVETLLKHGVKMCRFESNSAGGKIAQSTADKIKVRGGFTNITTKYSTANKETRIYADSPFIRTHFLFKDTTQYNKEYMSAMNMMTSYTMLGKNKHDDVVDALSMLTNFIEGQNYGKVEILNRFF